MMASPNQQRRLLELLDKLDRLKRGDPQAEQERQWSVMEGVMRDGLEVGGKWQSCQFRRKFADDQDGNLFNWPRAQHPDLSRATSHERRTSIFTVGWASFRLPCQEKHAADHSRSCT